MRNIAIALAAAFALALPATAKSSAKEVTCADGTTSKAGRGACSHHGGVSKSGKTDTEPSTGAPAKDTTSKKSKAQRSGNAAAEPADTNASAGNTGGILGGLFGRRSSNATPRSSTRDGKSAQPTARCKDGTLSYSAHHSGTCSGHGGVQDWLDR